MPVAKDNQFWDALMENKVAKKLIKKHKCKAKCENIDELAKRYEVSKQEVEKVNKSFFMSEEVFKIFQLMDDDGSGTISSSEVAKMLNELGIDVSPKVVQAVMRRAMSVETVKLTLRNFLQRLLLKLSTVKADVELMLSKIDNNPEKVVSITAEELVVAWSETVSTNITVKEAFALIQQADTQGRGKATIHEFITMCQTV
ncbi:Protein CBG16669 [Caenorhabditis briggsae]|uniref:Protein CBG16669 n=1 Tax=Caenorhabditis briggsae TaxID=6238 RepID=A8XPA0_CAEBR|nr:Protein CBG16669 [Caenorhabditis briggsae]CAP34580.2 Protein CBG16669 [Caenorhabditis briggsae]